MSDSDATILIIDRDPKIFDVLSKCMDTPTVHFDFASSLGEGLQKSRSDSYQVILMRDSLQDGDACYVVEDFQFDAGAAEIIVFTTAGDMDQAEIAIKSGVWEYLIDPDPEKALPELLHRALQYRLSKNDVPHRKQDEFRDRLKHHGIIGRSAPIQKCINFVARIAPSDANVLISGETGTGKDLFAALIHRLSSRAAQKMTIVDCAALPSTLVESILFGYDKGSFTGADKKQPGLVKQADGGTLFLDEVAEMPLETQKKFLRVIQERKYRPVGGNVETTSDFRLISATNKNLPAMVEAGTFREDLFFRLKTFHLELPPLRSRATDITELVYYYRDTYCRHHQLPKKNLSPDFAMLLGQYDWPGNVRELFQTIECSIASAQDSAILYAKHLPLNIRIEITRKKIAAMTEEDSVHGLDGPVCRATQDMPTLKTARDKAIADQEKKYLRQLLAVSKGNIQRSCEVSGLSRSRLYDLLKKYQLVHK
ncbi:sigma-54-dependent Fis family transcriptional regulator [Desulfopila sp. IMCC35006]|uniref:sigma-54-dependent transcriptional regulator n=1 Tax=Desulfopila sp. IMCC35006 TaxID=2569542 RepID=UPI0010ABA9CD|nr:sigma-54 dependent transcriptional regulator [Desulfopila sp. IMCC35006]TKB28315.1 sigma-54-dependent Fis family transcriptional regulator [Desulfopila sp. IMCC35006]